jgi:general secretion pathway protein G
MSKTSILWGASMNSRVNPSRGFSLVELLIVVAIIGTLATMAIPRFFAAMQSSKQKATMTDLRSVAVAVEAYNTDVGLYPKLGTTTAFNLEPVVGRIPKADAWSNLFRYDCLDGKTYSLYSMGADHTINGPWVYGPTRRFVDDIVISNGSFVQWPEGTQE